MHLNAEQHPAAPNLRAPLRAPSSPLCNTDRGGSSFPGPRRAQDLFLLSPVPPISLSGCPILHHDSPIFLLAQQKFDLDSVHVWPWLTKLTKANFQVSRRLPGRKRPLKSGSRPGNCEEVQSTTTQNPGWRQFFYSTSVKTLSMCVLLTHSSKCNMMQL